MAPLVVVLLDNHHGPDRRAEWISSILRGAGARVRIVAWDRRVECAAWPDPEPPDGEEVVRIAAPAAWGAGRATVKAVGSFWRSVMRRRADLLAGADVLVASDIYLLPLGRALTLGRSIPLLYDAREDWAALEAARRPRALRLAVTRGESLLARGAAGVIVPGVSRAARWKTVGVDPVVLRNVGLTRPRPASERRWDVAYIGLQAHERRPDLMVDLARRRPDLRVAIGGAGRIEHEIRAAAVGLPNLDVLGFVEDADAVLASAGVIVYGEDPRSPYSRIACPNTLYQAVRLRRPVVFYCGGELEQTARRFRVGIRCAADVEALSAAVDSALDRQDWEFDAAWCWLRHGAEDALQARLRALVPGLS